MLTDLSRAVKEGKILTGAGPTTATDSVRRGASPRRGNTRSPSPEERSESPDSKGVPESEVQSDSDKVSLRANPDDPLFQEAAGKSSAVSTASGTDPRPRRSIKDCYNTVFSTLPESDCPRAPPVPPKVPGSLSERLSKTTSGGEAQEDDFSPLPMSTVVLSAFAELDKVNSEKGNPWKVPQATARMAKLDASYRPPRPDPVSGLDLSAKPLLDKDASALTLSKYPKDLFACSYSLLETWEERDRRVLGLASQIDFLSSSLIEKLKEADGLNDEARLLASFLGQSTQMLASVSAANTAEMLRIRRDLALTTVSKTFVLSDQAVKDLKTAPLASPTLFGGIANKIKSENKEELSSEALMITVINANKKPFTPKGDANKGSNKSKAKAKKEKAAPEKKADPPAAAAPLPAQPKGNAGKGWVKPVQKKGASRRGAKP